MADPSRLLDWRVVQALLVGWILNTIESTLHKQIPVFKEVAPLWSYLKERFAISNGTRKSQIRKAMSNCEQGAGQTVEAYIGTLTALWNEQATYFPLPECQCGEIAGRLQDIRDEEHFHDFLSGLNVEMYGAIHSNLLS